jgi:hypothetical protein
MSDVQLIQRISNLEKRLSLLETMENIHIESGLYTPTYEGGTTPGTTTYAFQDGRYFIIGNIILITGQINWTNATGTGEARVSVPFTPTGGNYSGSLRIGSVTYANDTPQILISTGNLFFVMDSPATNAAGNRVQVENNTGSVIWTLVYAI